MNSWSASIPALAGHHDVERDEVGLESPGQCEAFVGAGGPDDVTAQVLQVLSQQLAGVGVVVDHQREQRLLASEAAGRREHPHRL